MKETAKNARLKNYSLLGLTMVIVVIPFCLYYLFFVTSQGAYYSKRNFRVLAMIGDQISTKIDILANNLVNVSERVKQDKVAEKKKEGEPKTDTQKEKHKEGERPPTDPERVQKAAKLVPDFKPEGVHYEPDPAPAARQGNNGTVPPKTGSNKDAEKPTTPKANAASNGAGPENEPRASGPASASLVTMDVKPELGSFGLALTYLSTSSELPGKLSVEKDFKQLFHPFVGRYVIDELRETRERLFDEVLVAEQDNGRVIFEEGPDGLTVVSLDNLSNSKGGKLELKLADPSSSSVDVQIAGADYKLFLQPIRLSLSASNDDKKQGVRLVVCGLTRTDHFREETFAVSYTVLIFFVFAVLLAALSWPLLKLKLMGPKDRLRRVDFAVTMFSALMGTALVTFILLDLHTHLSLNDALDQQLKTLSTTIESHFHWELGKALDQLDQLNNKAIPDAAKEEQSGAMRDLEDSKSKQPGKSGVARDIRPETSSGAKTAGKDTPSRSTRADILTSDLDWKTAPYPFFNNATWTDEKGQQRVKWTTRTEPTTFIPVSDRRFFKDAREDNTWKLEYDDKRTFEYSFELLNSKTTGENLAIIATRVSNSPWVSNLDTRLMSLIRTVLPPGYGYAIIDGGGNVIFHSDEVRNLEEQFFAECGNDRWLRAAVLARTDRFLDANYLGKGHRLYVSPLSNTPWTLVSFVDQRMARTINLEVITLSFVLYLLFALLILALISLGFLLRVIPVFSGRYQPTQGDGIRWLWPNPDLARRYGLLIIAYFLIALIFLLVLNIAGTLWLTIFCVAFPMLAAALWWLILTKATPPNAVATCTSSLSRSKIVSKFVTGHLSYRTRYSIAFAGFLALVSVLPAAGFFKIAHNFEMRLMVKHGQVSLAKAIEERNRRVADRYSTIKINAQGRQAKDDHGQSVSKNLDRKRRFLRQRVEWPSPESALGVYDSCFFDTKRFDPNADLKERLIDDSPGPLDCLLLEVRPLYNQSCVESQGLSKAASSDDQWRWKRNHGGDMLLWKDKDGRPKDASVALSSSIPSIVAPNTFWSWLRVILSIALIVILPYLLVRLVARRFFLLDLFLPDRIDLPLTTKWFGSYVLLHPPMTAEDRYKWDPAEYSVADLRNEKVGPEWIKAIAAKPPELTIVLDNFEHRMTDPAANREKLVAIEHLLKSGRRVVVVSTDCPFSFSLEPKPAAEVVTNSGEVKTVPSGSPALAGGTNGAADLKIEYHSALPFSVEVGGKQSVGTNGNAQAAIVAEVPEIDAQARWHELFTNFVTVCVGDNMSDKLDEYQVEFAGFLKTKTPWRYIEPIRNWIGIVQDGGVKIGRDRARIEELISEVGEQAYAYHNAIWASCSEGQRCTLIQLAQDGMISPKNRHLRRLVKRGLIVLDPSVRLMDESFRRFVKTVSRDQDVEGWRQQDGGSAWQLLRAPLLLILVGVALFLFITQKDFYDSTISFMSAATAGIAALFRLLGMFHGKDKGAPLNQG